MIIRLRRYRFALRAAIYGLPALSFYLAVLIRNRWLHLSLDPFTPDYIYLALFTTFVWCAIAEQKRVTSVTKVSAENTGIRAAVAACAITYIADLAVLFFTRQLFYSRLLFALSAFLLLFLTVAVRSLFRLVLRSVALRRPAVRVAIVGTGRFAARAAAQVQQNEYVRCQVIACLRVGGEDIRIRDVPVFHLEDREALEKLNVDNILIAIPPHRYGEIPKYIAALKSLCLPIRVIVDVGAGILVRERVVQLGRLQMLDFAPGPTSSLAYSIGKRVLDIVLSSGILAVLGGPMLAIALAVKVNSRGPALFRQQRVGRNGKLFTMFKFRTMRISPETEGDTVWTTAGDPRRTKLGSFLRKTSLDELPQFINVLRGEMSIVGPRPERPHFVKQFREDIALYPTRHHLDVGITGWAQVNGLRGNTSINRRVRYDLYYMQHWSLLFDLRIIWRTIWGGFTGKNAY